MPDAPVVSNTSPLIKLAGVGLLSILNGVYGDIMIPEAVRTEYHTGAAPADPDLDSIPWLHVHSVAIDPTVRGLSNLGPGESEAISLALVLNARFVLLDDKNARRAAIARGLNVVGTLAVLSRAKNQGLLPVIKPAIDQMIAQGRYISPALRAQVLRDVGEDPGS